MPLCVEVGLIPGDFVFDGNPALLPERGTEPPRNFRPMSIVYCGQMAGWIKKALDWRWALVQATLC